VQALGLSMIHAREQKQATTEPEVKVLERSLALAKPEGYLRLFVDMGSPMAALLRQAAARGVEPDYVHKLLDAFPVQAGAGRSVTSGIHSPFGRRSVPASLVEPLTERELEVLRLVAEGLSNREIAERLVVAIGTVKAHIHSICGKLDAQNRTQALVRAQQLGLLT
jgi:LuxR family maltose regulon positive regulatory protein